MQNAFRYNVAWSTREVRLLQEGMKTGQSAEELAITLRRTVNAVKGQLRRLRRKGDGPRLRRVPLHGVSTKGCHPIVQTIFKVAKTEGHTYQSLAKQVGVSRGAIEALAKRNPSFLTVIAVAQALDIELKAVCNDASKLKPIMLVENSQEEPQKDAA